MAWFPLFKQACDLAISKLYTISGISMTPSFNLGDRLLVTANTHGDGSLMRGDVVVVCDPREPSQHYLKRIVGLPLEEIRLFDGAVLVDGVRLVEPYLGGMPSSLGLQEGIWDLGFDEYFVMGDNRAHSTDSRHFGHVGLNLITGKAWLRVWPLDNCGSFL